ncbi:uncharacterized protein TRAVEDRAFT_28900 [Trametes versicolor FP-101664 SS1]|uniref:uncharacterized protein n=1 Tax=Trametes versicolor (strain FP-101664) TaxID=717944 RepID=UPI0004621EB6|nr:uncharacterized protein TRAVEDRAFT_28900 [Trametes versicolor FP-101664 SS1]EIW58167.1 hypothetical protein TRAVEDRAFT_28900 [Trametes versicolor FP-101664 SS1]
MPIPARYGGRAKAAARRTSTAPPHDHVPQRDNVRASLDVRASNRKVPFRRY